MAKKSQRSARRSVPLKKALDRQLLALAKAAASARLTGSHIDEHSYDFDAGEPDLGYLCLLTHDLLDNVVRTLASLRTSFLGSEPMAIATVIEIQRQQLFKVQAVLETMTHSMRTIRSQQREADLSPMFVELGTACESGLGALDPVALGLPIPNLCSSHSPDE